MSDDNMNSTLKVERVLSLLSEDTIDLTVLREPEYSYREDQILAELTAYIQKTYKQHYAAKDIQTIDVWQSLGIEKESCQSNVLKYAMRYGKKGGYNKDDLLKILHYTILWWHFTQPKDEII